MFGRVSSLRLLFTRVLAAMIVLVAARGIARAESSQRTVDLYTIGPSGDLVSRFGHSLLCVRPAGKDVPESGRCYDYGVPDREDIVHNAWTAMRNIPSFVPVAIDERLVLEFFKGQGRQIERQRLPLTEAEVEKLVSSIETEIREKRAYAYHPYWANCATKIRDHIDEATSGRLHAGPSAPPKGTLREHMEEGNSGHLGILTVMALYLGEGNDHVPSAWEAMLLPTVLRDGVAERFQAKPEQLAERMAVILPTSRAIGRIVVFFLAFVLFLAARLSARRGKLRVGMAIVGGVLGAFAISLELAAALVKWPEIAHNWSLLLFLPTDLLLSKLTGKRLVLYLRARVAIAALFVVLEVANVVHQPMLPLATLVALPMLGILSALKERAEEPSATASEMKTAA